MESGKTDVYSDLLSRSQNFEGSQALRPPVQVPQPVHFVAVSVTLRVLRHTISIYLSIYCIVVGELNH